MTRRALVLSGGGAHGAFQAGALSYLVGLKGLDFDVICGVSTGALSAVMLAQSPPGELAAGAAKLKAIYAGIKNDDAIYTGRFLGEIGLVIHSSIDDTHPIAKLIAQDVDPAKLKASGRQFRCGTVSLKTGQYRTVTQNDSDVVSMVLASASMPIYFPPVNNEWVDGGLTHQTPLADAFAALNALQSDGATPEMWVILCDAIGPIGADASSFSTGLPILERLIDILVANIFMNDIAFACAVNDELQVNADPTAGLAKGKSYVKLYVVMPTQLAGDTLEFNPTDIASNMAHGFARAQQPLDQAAVEKLLTTAGA